MAKMVLQVEDKPRPGQLISSVVQQLLANIAATITVPLIIGLGSHVSSAILGCGVGTLVYLLVTGRKSPVILSSNFSFVAALILAYAHAGFLGILIGGFLSGIIYMILAFIVKKVGTNWIQKVFPPVIIGPVVSLIGLTLASDAILDLLKVPSYSYTSVSGEIIYPYNLAALSVGLVVFFVIVVCAVQNRSKTLTMIPFLAGTAVGYLIALVSTLIGNANGISYLQIIDFSPVTENFKNVTFKSFISLPNMALIEGIKEIVDGSVKFSGMVFLEIALAFIPLSLVGFTEHIADHKNLSSIIERDLINDEPGLSRTLLGDGLGSIAGTCFGICPNTTYGESISCVAITKNASTFTILVTALTCIGLSFFTPLIAVFRTIPTCVIGGMCLSLFGFIAVSGLKMIKQIDFDSNKNIFTLSVILVAGIGSLSLKIPYQWGLISDSGLRGMVKWIEITPIAFALVLGLLTNFLCLLIEKKNLPEEVEN